MMHKIHKRKRYRKFRTKWYRKTAKKCLWIRQQTVVDKNLSNNMELLTRALEENAQEFEILLDTIYKAHTGQWSVYSDTPIGKMVYSRIQPSSDCSIELGDIRNRLLYTWFNAVRRYSVRKPVVPFYNYICRMSLWEMKTWLKRHTKMELQRDVPLYCKIEIDDFPKIDLLFVARGTKYPVLSKLCLFERYLIYMRYAQEASDREIGQSVGADPQTIGMKIDNLIDKIRRGFAQSACHRDQESLLS